MDPEMDLDLQEDQPDTNEHEDIESLKAELAKFKAIAGRRKEKLEEAGKVESPQPPTSNLTERLERLELTQQGYTNAQIEFLMDNGGSAALKKESVTKAIEAIKSQEQVERAADVSSGSGENIISVAGADVSNMSAAELREALLKNGG